MMENSRSNKKNETIANFDFPLDQSHQAQVASSLNRLATESGLLLPDFILKQMEESILRAVAQHSGGEREASSLAPNSRAIQVGIHLADAQSRPTMAGPPTARWSFFLVQKRGESAQLPALFLDLYLYQE